MFPVRAHSLGRPKDLELWNESDPLQDARNCTSTGYGVRCFYPASTSSLPSRRKSLCNNTVYSQTGEKFRKCETMIGWDTVELWWVV